MQKSSKLKQLATRLLATTCLTAATSVAAFGSTIVLTQGTQESFAARVIAPAGTNEVDGTVSLTQGSSGDWFEFTGLPSGASFSSLSLLVTDTSGSPINAFFSNDTPTLITSHNGVSTGSPYSPTGNVPGNTNLVVEIQPTNEGASHYTVTLNLPGGTPEPGTLGALGLGLAGMAGLGLRRRTKKS
jgi:hypothetical protein